MNASRISWKAPWRAIKFEAEIPGVQKQLNGEITSKHPLFDAKPEAIGRRIDCDDVLVRLNDGSYANVHLDWGTGPGAFPEEYPSWFRYGPLEAFIAAMELDASEYGDE